MLPEEERDALAKTLHDTIQENVPTALEAIVSDGVTAYQVSRQDRLEVFCLLVIHEDRLELRLPACPDIADAKGNFEAVPGTDACRLVIRKRTDIPGERLGAAIRAAAAQE